MLATWHSSRVTSVSSTASRADEVRLRLPGKAEYGRVARVGAAHLAHRRGFALAEIDDLRLAIDEAVIMLLGPSPRPGRIDVQFYLDDNTIVMVMQSVLDDIQLDLPPERIQRFEAINDDLVEAVIDAKDRSITLTKRTTSA